MNPLSQKKNPWTLAVIVLALSTFFLGCPPADDPCAATKTLDCSPYQAANLDTGFILQIYPWEDFPNPKTDPCRYEFMIFELETYLFNLPPGSIEKLKVRQECNCGFVLVDIEFAAGVDLNNSGTASATKPKKQDDGSGGIIAAVDRNYKLNFGPFGVVTPLNIPPSYYYDEETADTLFPTSLPIPVGPVGNDANTVIAAIIDSGVDYLHDSIKSRTVGTVPQSVLWYNVQEGRVAAGGLIPPTAFNDRDEDTDPPNNCLVDDVIGFDYYDTDVQPMDLNGHGTHIAGVIASATAISGAVPSLMSLKIGGYPDGSQDFEVDLFAALCALEYAIENGAQVINMSWGFYAENGNVHLDKMIDRAVKQDILMVASVGNDGISIDSCTHWPSNYSTIHKDHVISVGALAQINSLTDPIPNPFARADFSNYGSKVDIYAPGKNINAAKAGSFSGTHSLNGTSMAAAFISRQLVIELANGKRPEDVKGSILQASRNTTDICFPGKAFDYPQDNTLNDMIRQ